MYAQLGNIIFTPVKGFTDVSVTSETNLVEHALIDGKPKIQRVGTNLETMEITILFDVAFCTPQSEVDALNSSREAGEVMPLVMGSGRFVGNYVIKSVQQTKVHEATDGTLLQAEVSLSLMEFANKQLNQAVSQSAISSAFATTANVSQTFSNMTQYQSVEQVASMGVVASQAAIGTASDTLSKLGSSVQLYRAKAEQVIRDMNTATSKFNTVLDAINNDTASDLYAITRDLAVSIGQTLVLVSDTAVEAEALIADIDNDNTSAIPDRVAALINRANELRSRNKLVAQNASNLANYIATH